MNIITVMYFYTQADELIHQQPPQKKIQTASVQRLRKSQSGLDIQLL